MGKRHTAAIPRELTFNTIAMEDRTSWKRFQSSVCRNSSTRHSQRVATGNSANPRRGGGCAGARRSFFCYECSLVLTLQAMHRCGLRNSCGGGDAAITVAAGSYYGTPMLSVEVSWQSSGRCRFMEKHRFGFHEQNWEANDFE